MKTITWWFGKWKFYKCNRLICLISPLLISIVSIYCHSQYWQLLSQHRLLLISLLQTFLSCFHQKTFSAPRDDHSVRVQSLQEELSSPPSSSWLTRAPRVRSSDRGTTRRRLAPIREQQLIGKLWAVTIQSIQSKLYCICRQLLFFNVIIQLLTSLALNFLQNVPHFAHSVLFRYKSAPNLNS